MSNVKAGDLAIIVRAKVCPELLGMIVEVVRPVVPGETLGTGYPIRESGGLSWVIRDVGGNLLPTTLSLRGTEDVTKKVMVKERAYLDSAMKPVTGLPLNDDVEQEDKLKV